MMKVRMRASSKKQNKAMIKPKINKKKKDYLPLIQTQKISKKDEVDQKSLSTLISLKSYR